MRSIVITVGFHIDVDVVKKRNLNNTGLSLSKHVESINNSGSNLIDSNLTAPTKAGGKNTTLVSQTHQSLLFAKKFEAKASGMIINAKTIFSGRNAE